MRSQALVAAVLAILLNGVVAHGLGQDTHNSAIHLRSSRARIAQQGQAQSRRTLFSRDTCPADRPVSCSAVDSKLPGNFCCGSGNSCLSLASGTAALCCPAGQTCAQISPISCDITLQDPNLHPTQPIFTTNTSSKLPTCGDKCCPLGYTCSQSNGQSICSLDNSKAITTQPSSTTASQTGKPTTTKTTSTTKTTATATPTGSASGIDSNNPPPAKESSFSVGTFFAGFIPGIFVGVLATLAWVVLTDRIQKPAAGGEGPRPYISAPIAVNQPERADFLARTRSRARSLFSNHRHTQNTNSTDFWNAKMPTPPEHSNVPVNYLNNMPDVPVTPGRRVAHYPSNGSLTREIDEKDFAEPPRGISRGHDTVPTAAGNTGSDNPNRSETIHIYSPELSRGTRTGTNDVPPMPAMPPASVAPLRGMNVRHPSQSQSQPPHPAIYNIQRRDSGTAMKDFGSPFRTPEKKPQIVTVPPSYPTQAHNAVYHDATTLDSAVSPISPSDDPTLQTLTPARYNPYADPSSQNIRKSLHPTTRPPPPTQLRPANPTPSRAADNNSNPNQSQGREDDSPYNHNPDFDFNAGLDSPRHPALMTPTFNPKPGHATNATTFTGILRAANFPDPMLEAYRQPVPAIPAQHQNRQGARTGLKNLVTKGRRGVI